jgi:hypothetical protein
LVYSTERKITAAGNEVLWAFLVNSAYDPDFTYTGSQPPYFDEWGQLYSRYRVVDAMVESKVSNYSGAHCKVTQAPLAQDPTGYATEDVAGWRNSAEDDFNSGGSMAVVRTRVKPHQCWGVSEKAYLADDDFAATITASPQNKVFLALCAKTDGATDSVWLSVRVTLSVRFERPRIIALSSTARVPKAVCAASTTTTSGGDCAGRCVACRACLMTTVEYCPKCGAHQ